MTKCFSALSFLRLAYVLAVWQTFLTGLVIVVVVSATESSSPAVVVNCNDAQKRCMQQMGCSIAIHNYMIHCSALINGETDRCSDHCSMALISLLSTEDQTGETFMTCNCGEHQFCRESKRRLEACSLAKIEEAVKEVFDPAIRLSCSLAEMICSADTSCFTALGFYEEHCRKLIKGSKCTGRCNNSLSILYRQPKALKLRDCLCDGSEKYDCPALRYHIETLCFHKHITPPPRFDGVTSPPRVRHPTHHHTRSHHHDDDNRNNPPPMDDGDRGTISGKDGGAEEGGDENRVDTEQVGKSALKAQHNGANSAGRSASPSLVVYTRVLVLAALVIMWCGIHKKY